LVIQSFCVLLVFKKMDRNLESTRELFRSNCQFLWTGKRGRLIPRYIACVQTSPPVGKTSPYRGRGSLYTDYPRFKGGEGNKSKNEKISIQKRQKLSPKGDRGPLSPLPRSSVLCICTFLR